MSGTASVPNSFASAVTATGAQLDTNYASIIAYVNDPTNRNNYAADTGNTNTIVLTMSPPVLGYTAGLGITFKAANTNSGASVVNVNALGNKSLVNPGGGALTSAQVTIGSTYEAVYDGTQFVGIGFQSSGAVNSLQLAKAWASWPGTSTGTITAAAGYGVTNIAKIASGTWSVALSTAMSSTAYAVVGSCDNSAFTRPNSKTTAGFFILIQDASSSGQAVGGDIQFVVYGS